MPTSTPNAVPTSDVPDWSGLLAQQSLIIEQQKGLLKTWQIATFGALALATYEWWHRSSLEERLATGKKRR
jgi:hypothetical protein